MNINPLLIKCTPAALSFKAVCSPSAKPAQDTFTGPLDIRSTAEYPLDILSNFTRSYFVVDNISINSMEGFLQSLKIPDEDEQRQVCSLIGFTAKKIGSRKAEKYGFDGKTLYWQGRKIDRYSEEYQDLLKTAYSSRYSNDPSFRLALDSTKGRVLTHTIGKQDPEETILTEKEFVTILMDLRDGKI